MVAIDAVKADMGSTLLLGLLMSIPVAIVAGPLFTYWAAPRASAAPPVDLVARLTRTDDQFRSPGIGVTILTILFPILLMLGKAAVDLALPVGHPLRTLFEFIGNPAVALLLAVILSMFTFGFFLGKDTKVVGKLLGDALPPISAIMLIIGAGGALKQMLIDVKLGAVIATASQMVSLSPILLGWFIAVIMRLATGSATVAIVTASGLMAATVTADPSLNPSLLALSIGAMLAAQRWTRSRGCAAQLVALVVCGLLTGLTFLTRAETFVACVAGVAVLLLATEIDWNLATRMAAMYV
jgi:GntP family gluconate:H+ symporter